MAPPHYPVKVGRMLYSLNDPDKGYEVAYNRWYERDHFYAGQMIGPWIFAGSRWIATRELKVLRIPNDDTNAVTIPWDAGSYLAIYWLLQGHEDEYLKWAGENVRGLYANNRGFDERTHRHTVFYDYRDTIYRDDDPVPIELALDHHYNGQVSIAIDRASGVSETDLDEWLRRDGIPTLLAGSAIAMGSLWTPVQRDELTSNTPMHLGSPTGGENRISRCSSPRPTCARAGIASSTT